MSGRHLANRLGIMPAWPPGAVCTRDDTDDLFPERGVQASAVRATIARLCDRCPIRTECLEWALTRPEPFGIWGGTTDQERRVMRRQRRKAGLQ